MHGVEGESEALVFTGLVTHPGNGLPLHMCPRGFSLTRPTGEEAVATMSQDGSTSVLADAAVVFRPGEVWSGSYECSGNPTAAWLEVLAIGPAGLRANFSFHSVTDSGVFAVGIPMAEGAPLELKLYGEPRVLGTVTASSFGRRQASEQQGSGGVQTELVLHGADHGSEVLEPHRLAVDDMDADLRLAKLVRSLEAVYNRTRQSPRRLVSLGIWPVVLFRVHFAAITAKQGLMQVEAVVERKWVGRQRVDPTAQAAVFEPASAGRRQKQCTRTGRPLHTVLTLQAVPYTTTDATDGGLSEEEMQALTKLLAKASASASTFKDDGQGSSGAGSGSREAGEPLAGEPVLAEVQTRHGTGLDSAGAQQLCPTGYTAFRSHCYYFAPAKRSFEDAEDACAWTEDGGVEGAVVCVDDAEENAWLAAHSRFAGAEFWIGYNDRRRERQFEWASGCGSSFESWNQGEPNNGDSTAVQGDCVRMCAGERVGGHVGCLAGAWADSSCARELRYICEFPMADFDLQSVGHGAKSSGAPSGPASPSAPNQIEAAAASKVAFQWLGRDLGRYALVTHTNTLQLVAILLAVLLSTGICLLALIDVRVRQRR